MSELTTAEAHEQAAGELLEIYRALVAWNITYSAEATALCSPLHHTPLGRRFGDIVGGVQAEVDAFHDRDAGLPSGEALELREMLLS